MQLHVTDAYGRTHVLFGPYDTLGQVRAANQRINHHFFDPDTLAFFNSEIYPPVLYGRLFVTSEQYIDPQGNRDPRLWTVRCAGDDGRVSTIGGFQAHPTHQDASHAIETLVKRARADQKVLGDREPST